MSATYASSARRITALSMSLLASALVVTACDDDPITPVDRVEWEAQLAGAGEYVDVEGAATVSAAPTEFEATVEIEGADAAAEFTWQVAAGTCAAPGARIGAANRYPNLEVAANGTASAEADVIAALDEEDDYIVRVLDESGNTPVSVACAALAIEE